MPVTIDSGGALTDQQIRESSVVGLRIHYCDNVESAAMASLKLMHTLQVAQNIKPKDTTGPYWEHIIATIENVGKK